MTPYPQPPGCKTSVNGYDLVLVDTQMPVIESYSATVAIRRWEKG